MGLSQWSLVRLRDKLRDYEMNQSYFCIYCNISFEDKEKLREHCGSRLHELIVMSDEGRDWKKRPPPRGYTYDAYKLCPDFEENQSCRFGKHCVQAHGYEEIAEWKDRFRYREMRLKRAKEKELFGKSHAETLLDKLLESPNPLNLMKEAVDGIEDHCSSPLATILTSKNTNHTWNFDLNTLYSLRAILFLHDSHRNHFRLESVSQNDQELEIGNDQEWLHPEGNPNRNLTTYKVAVSFKGNIYGTFRQSIVFDFGFEPMLVKHLLVEVVSSTEVDKIFEIRKEVSLISTERWSSENCIVIPFQSPLNKTDNFEKTLKHLYPPPNDDFFLSATTIKDFKFRKNNYKRQMHEMIAVEEMARFKKISKYNLSARIQITLSYILAPNSQASSTAKYCTNGELFAVVPLGRALSEDTSEGRLILMHCHSVYLHWKALHPKKKTVFEALIEDKTKDEIYLRLSTETVNHLKLKQGIEIEVEIQFQLNRIRYCEWHCVVDRMKDFSVIFPDTFLEPSIPWNPGRQWSGSLDARLNLKQKEAVVAITTPLEVKLPPILVIGPFGTGKTFTLAQAVKELIKNDENRILLCTHSNSAADLYIKDYLDSWVQDGDLAAKPLRIYYKKRWVSTVHPIVQKYCLTAENQNTRLFEIPSFEQIKEVKIVVVTLSTSIYLMDIVPKGYFTHILLDEAAQAIECEAITPLVLADDNTRIVLAGDHMQLGPDIFSKFAIEHNLHISLLERLYDHYPKQFPCKILLCENYRAHEGIIQFTSESFYDQRLVSSSKQPQHDKYYPLTFFASRGEDIQDKNSTAFYNVSEVYEVVERVVELRNHWPSSWGKRDDQSIGVVTPYADQVFRIRSELRKRRIDNVCVERVLNVQGKQFRVIILSTVRTRKTCDDSDELDFGFLSNSKLLNTAVTRAQSLVAVVGDPVTLCSIGRCSKIWERFIRTCDSNNSLFGMSWSEIKFQLDGIELKKIYNLNPLAPEFYPRNYVKTTSSDTVVRVHPVPAPAPALPAQRFVSVMMGPPPPPPQTMHLYSRFPPITPNGYLDPRSLIFPPAPMLPRPPLPPPMPMYPVNPMACFPRGNVPVGPQMQDIEVFNECTRLLPKNMSLADMILKPADFQEKWYMFLKQCVSVQAGEKFKHLLRLMNQKSSTAVNSVFENFSYNNLGVNGNEVRVEERGASGVKNDCNSNVKCEARVNGLGGAAGCSSDRQGFYQHFN